MCVGLPGRVVEVDPAWPEFAMVDVSGRVRRVSVALLDVPPVVGDWVVVQLGFALEKLTEAEAQESIMLLQALSDAAEGELSLDLEALTEAARPGPAVA